MGGGKGPGTVTVTTRETTQEHDYSKYLRRAKIWAGVAVTSGIIATGIMIRGAPAKIEKVGLLGTTAVAILGIAKIDTNIKNARSVSGGVPEAPLFFRIPPQK
jgi:hypothetical protein